MSCVSERIRQIVARLERQIHWQNFINIYFFPSEKSGSLFTVLAEIYLFVTSNRNK